MHQQSVPAHTLGIIDRGLRERPPPPGPELFGIGLPELRLGCEVYDFQGFSRFLSSFFIVNSFILLY